MLIDRNMLLAATRGDSLKLINLRMNQVSGTLRLVIVNLAWHVNHLKFYHSYIPRILPHKISILVRMVLKLRQIVPELALGKWRWWAISQQPFYLDLTSSLACKPAVLKGMWIFLNCSPDGSYVACGSQDGSIFIWDTSSLKTEKVLKSHGCVLTRIPFYFTPLYQANEFACKYFQCKVSMRSKTAEIYWFVFISNRAAVVTCAWNPEGNALVSCDRNKQVIVWSALIWSQ